MRTAAAIILIGILLTSGTYLLVRHDAATSRAAARPEVSVPKPSAPVTYSPAAGTNPARQLPAMQSRSGEEERLTPAQLAKARELQEKLVEGMYGDLELELGLTRTKAAAVRAAIVDQHMRDMATPEAITGNAERAAYRSLLDSVATLLDPEEAVRFEGYSRSIDARAQIMWLAAMLEEARLPLSEEQRRNFTHAAIRNGAYLLMQDIPPSDSATEYLNVTVVRGEQRDQLLLRSARGILSPAQLRKVEAYFRERHAALNQSLYIQD
ncbi:MAG TPA: hypothetical protein VFP37_02835 [Steroidobacteraceae bacterium]|nr:hypothetical protein [Steroidobacteraceae bacterium]